MIKRILIVSAAILYYAGWIVFSAVIDNMVLLGFCIFPLVPGIVASVVGGSCFILYLVIYGCIEWVLTGNISPGENLSIPKVLNRYKILKRQKDTEIKESRGNLSRIGGEL